jgi:hypothetical protein
VIFNCFYLVDGLCISCNLRSAGTATKSLKKMDDRSKFQAHQSHVLFDSYRYGEFLQAL